MTSALRSEPTASPNAGPTSIAPVAPVAPKRSKVLPVIGLLALLGIGWMGKTWYYNQSHENTENAQVDGSIVPVIAKISGYVKAVKVNENQRVSAGDVIVQLDDAEYAVRLAQSDAELAAASFVAGGKGQDGQAEAQIRSAASQGQVVQAQIQAARAAQAKASADLNRMKELVVKQIVSRQQLDAAQSAYDQATATVAATERQANTAAAQLNNAEIGSKFAQARLAGAKATRDNAALQLSYASVTASHL